MLKKVCTYALILTFLAGYLLQSNAAIIENSCISGTDITICTDKDGNELLPDHERSKNTFGVLADDPGTENRLTFTFGSPEHPWSTEELEVINNAVNDFYPVIVEVCGSPAFSNTVNIKKEPDLSSNGLYESYSNTITLKSLDRLDTLCHEIIHAFRDDYIITIGSFEEGMTRAAQIEVFSRLDKTYPFADTNHSYELDVYYETLNEHKLGGDIGSGYISMLLFYQLCGYAWGKAVIEDQDFFVNFNRELYKRCRTDISTKSTEDKLIDIVETIKPTVESTDFNTWYNRLGCFNLTPPQGAYIYQRINQFTIDYFKRAANGQVFMQSNKNVEWYIYDCNDNLLCNGSGVTNDNGFYYIDRTSLNPISYQGRIKVVAEITDFGSLVRDTSLRPYGNESGVFGIVADTVSGKITFTPFDTQYPQVSVQVVNGAFSAPSLKGVKGTIKAVYENETGEMLTKIFTKDASDYLLVMAPYAPHDVQAEVQKEQITLNWNPIEDINCYNIKRNTKIDEGYETIAEGFKGTSYIDNVPDTSSTYYYTVTSVSAGNESVECIPVKAAPTVQPSPTPSSTAPSTEVPIPSPSPKIKYGDVDGDGLVTSIDFGYMRGYLLGIFIDFPSATGEKAADVDGHGDITSIDFAYMRQYLLGMIDTFPAEYKLF